jgi:hypothetical protein
LARAIYNPRSGELAGALRDPAELCKSDLADRTAVGSLLFDAFIPAAYRHDPAGRWKMQDCEKWLVFLARHLERNVAGPDLAWWQLPLAIPGFAFVSGVALGIAVGVVFGILTGVALGVALGVVVGVAVAVVVGVVTARESPTPVRGIRWQSPSRGTVVIVVAVGVVTGVAVGNVSGAAVGVTGGVMFGTVAGLVGWVTDQKSAPLDISSAASPQAVLAGDRRTGTVVGLVFGLVFGPVFGLMAGGLAGARVGVGVGVVAGVVLVISQSFSEAAWPSYAIARILLALRHRLPWPLMDFLADAHRRGVLRQAGAVYQFRHIELQHRLATRRSPPDDAL